MKTKIIFIILLFIINLFAYKYLEDIYQMKVPFTNHFKTSTLLFPIKEIKLDSIDDFIFEDYFLISTIDKYSYNYEFDDKLRINLITEEENLSYEFDYSINEPLIIEKEIIKEIYIEKLINNQNINYEQNHNKEEEIIVSNEDEFYLLKDILSFNSGTNISNIIEEASKVLVTSIDVTADYANLNPNEIGDYFIYFYSKKGTLSLKIQIF